MQPTPEQLAIITAARESTDNLIIHALAGTGKTTTLELLGRALPVQPALSLAFNKRIAEEMAKRLPGHIACKTMNSLGHGVWAKACARRLTLDTRKSYELLKQHVDALPRTAKSEAYENFTDTLRAVGRAKLSGYVPEGKYPNAKRLISSWEFWDAFEESGDSPDRALVDAVLTDSIRDAYAGRIDYDDQIYMPTLFGGTFPRFPLILVDEAQDLSALNHAMLAKLVVNRIIAVGDPNQSIYGFRGAVSNGMEALKETFSMRTLPLTVSFRCPVEVVKLARKRVPQMQWSDWAKSGSVSVLDELPLTEIADGAAIICRNNAPLFSCALRLIAAGRGVRLIGSELGPALVKILKKLGPESIPQDQVMRAIDSWQASTVAAKPKAKRVTAEKAECLRVFAAFGNTLGAAIAYAEILFAAKGPIQLLSGHKAKGLEWDTVYHLDPWRIPSEHATTDEAMEQELNLEYVINTRSKDKHFEIDLERIR